LEKIGGGNYESYVVLDNDFVDFGILCADARKGILKRRGR